MQNGIVTEEYLNQMLAEPFDDIRKAIMDSLKQLFLQEQDDGKVSVAFKLHMEEKDVPDPTMTAVGGMRQITELKMDYSVKHAVTIQQENKGTIECAGYELDFDNLGNVRFKRVRQAQTTIFDEDSAANYGLNVDADGNKVSAKTDEEVQVELAESGKKIDLLGETEDSVDPDDFDLDEAFFDDAPEDGSPDMSEP